MKSYTGEYHEFVAVVLLWVQSTSNNAKCDKWVMFSSIALHYDGTDFIMQTWKIIERSFTMMAMNVANCTWNFIARSSTNECTPCALL